MSKPEPLKGKKANYVEFVGKPSVGFFRDDDIRSAVEWLKMHLEEYIDCESAYPISWKIIEEDINKAFGDVMK